MERTSSESGSAIQSKGNVKFVFVAYYNISKRVLIDLIFSKNRTRIAEALLYHSCHSWRKLVDRAGDELLRHLDLYLRFIFQNTVIQDRSTPR